MIVRTRGQALGVTHGLNIKEIARTSRLVSMTTGYSVQPNKAVVGASAFAHESGIHQHGVLSNRATYEIMDPVEIGLEGNRLVLGKHSGRHAFVDALAKIGHRRSTRSTWTARSRGSRSWPTARSRSPTRTSRRSSPRRSGRRQTRAFSCSSRSRSAAARTCRRARTVRLRRGEEMIEESAMGDGMIDAACGAIQRAAGVEARLIIFNVSSVTGGSDALGDVVVQLESTAGA